MEALMRAAPLRFLSAALWPMTIWVSLSHLEEHAADDYVERTSPIVAAAVAFWLCVAALVVLLTPVAASMGAVVGADEFVATYVRRAPEAITNVIVFFTPVLYVVGLWLFSTRDEAFPR
jgi:hypothetical protein